MGFPILVRHHLYIEFGLRMLTNIGLCLHAFPLLKTLRPKKLATILQTTFQNYFSCMKIVVFWLNFTNFVPRSLIENTCNSALIQAKTWCQRARKEAFTEPILTKTDDTMWCHYSCVPNSRTYRNRWTLGKNCPNLIVEHLFYTISIATNNRTPGIFFHCVNSQMRLTIRDTRVGHYQYAGLGRVLNIRVRVLENQYSSTVKPLV